jgi:hypothetical protein
MSVLPFDAFLEVLRAKGYGVGLHEYAALANLLQHWDRTHTTEFGDAVAALVGRNDEEVRGIRRLFNEVYVPPPPPKAVSPPTPHPLIFLRRRAWWLAVAAAVVVLVAASWNLSRRRPVAPEPPPVVPPVVTPTATEAVSLPPPPPPALPPPPRRVDRPIAVEVLGSGFLAVLALFWALKARDDKRVWLRQAWTYVRAALPGPYHFREVLRDQSARLPRSDVEDAATILGRVFSAVSLAREIDVPRSLRLTLRRGLMASLVFKLRRAAQPILVLQDVCQEMRLWDAKVDALLADLRRQGISLECWYFDGDLRRASERPHRPASGVERVLRGRPESPVMIISTGTGLAATLATPDDGWLRMLRDRPLKTWLTPVTDVRLWPRELDTVPLDVWPMTHFGLTKAARQLAGIEGEAGPEIRSRLVSEGRVRLDDVERLKRLASLVPHPSPGLLDVLRRHFAPDISDAAVLHLLTQAEGPAAPVIRLSEDELRRSLNAVRSENPDLEAVARKAILDVLRDSEPVSGSAAHERWRIAVGVQKLLLADLEGSHAETEASVVALRALGRGPMWEEVQEALRIVPGTSRLTELKTLVPSDGRDSAPPSEDERVLAVSRVPWSWPGWREIVPAAVTALLMVSGGVLLNALPTRTIEHLQEAYQLEYAPTPPPSTPQLFIQRRPGEARVPTRVDLYQDDRLFRKDLPLSGDATRTVQLAADDTGKYYQVRARLPDGNLAVSNAVWVASDRLAFILVDASPWANVTVRGSQTTTGSQQTPFTAALLPGSYQLHFENPALNPPSTTELSITVPIQGNAVHVTMPGFDPARAVDTLLQRGR